MGLTKQQNGVKYKLIGAVPTYLRAFFGERTRYSYQNLKIRIPSAIQAIRNLDESFEIQMPTVEQYQRVFDPFGDYKIQHEVDFNDGDFARVIEATKTGTSSVFGIVYPRMMARDGEIFCIDHNGVRLEFDDYNKPSRSVVFLVAQPR